MSKRTQLLNKLKHVYSHNAKLVLDVENNDIELIIEGVEKQIRKKPIGRYLYAPHYRCCTCKEIVQFYSGDRKDKHCSNCGQKLDWSEADE